MCVVSFLPFTLAHLRSSCVVMIVSACLFILGYAMTWAPGIWILTGETFPTRTRSMQAALAAASNWTWNFLLAFFTPFIVGAIDFRYGFVFAGRFSSLYLATFSVPIGLFLACNLTGAVIVYFFLYESSDLSLESVDMMYYDPNCKPWISRQWAPEGFSSRAELVEQSKAAEAGKGFAGAEEGRIEHKNESANGNGHSKETSV